MKKFLTIIPLVILLCFTFGFQKQGEEVAEEPVVDVEADIRAIKALLDEFDVSLNAGDFERRVSLYYAEDAVRMPPDEPMVKGKAAILAWSKKGAELYTYQLDNVAEDVQVDGDLAFMRGTFSGTLTPKAGGEPITALGKWMAVYKRQVDGSWKCIADIYNSDNPLPPPSPEKE
jgi:ketosteroid isomerase-like protein